MFSWREYPFHLKHLASLPPQSMWCRCFYLTTSLNCGRESAALHPPYWAWGWALMAGAPAALACWCFGWEHHLPRLPFPVTHLGPSDPFPLSRPRLEEASVTFAQYASADSLRALNIRGGINQHSYRCWQCRAPGAMPGVHRSLQLVTETGKHVCALHAEGCHRLKFTGRASLLSPAAEVCVMSLRVKHQKLSRH